MRAHLKVHSTGQPDQANNNLATKGRDQHNNRVEIEKEDDPVEIEQREAGEIEQGGEVEIEQRGAVEIEQGGELEIVQLGAEEIEQSGAFDTEENVTMDI